MITIISGTNRPNNKTLLVAKKYQELLKSKNIETRLLSLEDFSSEFIGEDMYNGDVMSVTLQKIQQEYIFDAEKIIIVSPEYNGSIPGILKLFIDALSVREYKRNFNKKFALVGVASGRAGNLFGMVALTHILNHVGGVVYPNKLPVSSIDSLIQEDGEFVETTVESFQNQLDGFLEF